MERRGKKGAGAASPATPRAHRMHGQLLLFFMILGSRAGPPAQGFLLLGGSGTEAVSGGADHGIQTSKVQDRPGGQTPALSVPGRDLRRRPAVFEHRGMVAFNPGGCAAA